ncbi:MAG: pyruvate dehydrogenase complex dihydrolipoamide acetyltransferase [Alphaproteobacteria bacterium]|nr:pyruvate dehydrogenase complex dihydrolipoamide acetyltransferase [Alphaproteobacteria bacterium]
MPTPITMPALSPTMEEGTLAKWLVKVGDTVKSGDIIAEIETDKATMEVEAVDEGVISKLLVEAGTEGVKVNAVIAELTVEGEAGPPSPKAAEVDRAPPRETEGAGLEATHTPPSPPKADAETATKPSVAPRPVQASSAVSKNAARLRSSPLARRLASAQGIDLAALKGSGPHGRIIKADVKKAPKGVAKPAIASGPAGGISSLIEPAILDERVYHPDTFELIPLDAVRRVTARRLTQSFMQAPHFPLEIDLSIDHLLSARKAINEALGDKGKISVNDMLIKAAALALMAQPDANASFTDKGIARHKSAHVSMAVAIEGGLITPVIRNAQTKGLLQIALETKDLAARARDRRLKPQEYMGGTFSISNLGMFGIKSFASILNPPEGMILSVGEGAPRAVVRDGKVEIATILSVTLTCDHRVVDGATGARWLQHFRQFVETPESMLL